MELVISDDLLDQRVPIVLKQDEVPQVIQKQFRIKESSNDLLQLVLQQRPVIFVLNHVPWHEPFLIRRQRIDSRIEPIADYERHVVGH